MSGPKRTFIGGGSGGGGGGGGATDLEGLSDVDLTGPADNQVLTYNGTVWVNEAPSGGGGGAASDPAVTVIADAGDGVALDVDDGRVYDITLTEDANIGFAPGVPDDELVTLKVLLRQDATGGWTPSFTSSPTFLGSGELPLATAPGAVSLYDFATLDGGATWYGHREARPRLEGLGDTWLSTPAAGQVLTFDGSDWVNQAAATANLSFGSSLPATEGEVACGVAHDGTTAWDRQGVTERFTPTSDMTVASVKLWAPSNINNGAYRVGLAEDFDETDGVTINTVPWLLDEDANDAVVAFVDPGLNTSDWNTFEFDAPVELDNGTTYSLVLINDHEAATQAAVVGNGSVVLTGLASVPNAGGHQPIIVVGMDGDFDVATSGGFHTRFQLLAAPPPAPEADSFFFSTTEGLHGWDGTEWVKMADLPS